MELFPLDPERNPLPDCLRSLGDLRTTIDYDAAGAIMRGTANPICVEFTLRYCSV